MNFLLESRKLKIKERERERERESPSLCEVYDQLEIIISWPDTEDLICLPSKLPLDLLQVELSCLVSQQRTRNFFLNQRVRKLDF